METEAPRIVIVGAGAMGCLFGGLLTEGGLDVTLVDIWKDHVDAINRDGLRIVGHGGDRTVRVKATTDPGGIAAADVVLFQCKAFANDEAARSVRHLVTGPTAAISFQNGLGHEETLSRILGAEHVLAGLTAQGATVVRAGVIRNFGDLPTYIGEPTGVASGRAAAIADAFTRHGLPTFASADIRKQKWQKLLGNAALGAASAATDMTSAEMVAIPELRAAIDGFRGAPQRLDLPTAPKQPLLYLDQPNRPQPRFDAGRERGMTVTVGRLRPCHVLDWKFVALGHNTVRGAAGAAVLNAELMLAEGWLD